MKNLLKRAAAIFVAIIMVVPSVPTISYASSDTEDVNVLVDENFDGTSFDSNIQGRGATIGVTEDTTGNHELTISGRTSDWNGIQIPVDSTVGSTVTASMKVRSANTECVLGIQYVPSGSSDTKYDWIKNLATKADTYTEISGTYSVPAGATKVCLYLQGNGTVNLENIMVDDIKVTSPKTAPGPVSTVVENFEGATNIAIARGATIAVVDGAGVDGSKALYVSGRTDTWQGVNFDAASYAGKTVTVSAKVKSAATSSKISIQVGEGDSASYSQVAQGTTGGDGYVTLTGNYSIPSGTTPIYLYVENNDTSDFYVDDFTVSVLTVPEKSIQEDLTPLKDFMAQSSAISGKMGVAIPVSALDDPVRMRLVTKHFSSITCENEMKPDSFLGSTPTLDADGNLELNFSSADKIFDYIYAYNQEHPSDIIKIRGHVLLWHSQTPTWFFRENYQADGAYVSKEVMLQRLDYYIKTVVNHFCGEDSKYKGMIYAWDVVNEQIDNGGIRVNNGSSLSDWYQIFKGDDLYIKEAFRLANLYIPKETGIKLFYNDYGETDSNKVTAICKLIQDIKDYPGTRIDGMGMQAHYGMVSPSVSEFEKAVRAYAALVDEIQITEFDISASSDYNGTNKDTEYVREGYRYKELFDKMYQLDQEPGIDITAVTVWGTHDGASWLNGSRSQCPLIFDDNYQSKPAYYGIVDPSQLAPITNRIKALYSPTANWSVIPTTTYTGDGTEVSFKTVWNNENLKLQVQVKDNTVSADDKIMVYVDEANSKTGSAVFTPYELPRSSATAIENGYVGVITIPLSDIKVGKTIGLDVVVSDNGKRLSWNDATNSQDTSSKYYGEVVLKPFAEFQYGTPVIDGNQDDIWKTKESLPLTVKTTNPVATANVSAMWDDQYLYVYADITDPTLSKASSNAWEQDSLEVFIDQNNGKTSSYEADDCQYRINYENTASFNGTKCNATNLQSATKLTDHGYIVEAAFKWTDVTPANGTLIGVDFQINDDAGSGSRAGTYNWYDDTGSGWSSPAVFGTVSLTKKSTGGNDNPGGNQGGNNNPGGNNPGGNGNVQTGNSNGCGGNEADNNIIKVNVKTLKVASKSNKTIAYLLKNSKAQGVYFSVSGTALYPKRLAVPVTGAVSGSSVYIYYINDQTGRLETLAYGYSYLVDKDGNVIFKAPEVGNYVILLKKAAPRFVTALKDRVKVKGPKTLKVGNSALLQIQLPATLEIVKSLNDKTKSELTKGVVVSYQSSDESVATVDDTGKVTALKSGKVTITITIQLFNHSSKRIQRELIITK